MRVSCVFRARGCVLCLCVCYILVYVSCGSPVGIMSLYYTVCIMRVACGCFRYVFVCQVCAFVIYVVYVSLGNCACVMYLCMFFLLCMFH